MEEDSLEISYEEDYRIEDPAFFEPLIIFKPVGIAGYAWWNERTKVEKLIEAFKMDLTIHEACIYAGISGAQYKNFCHVHPQFIGIKSRLKGVLAIAVKQGLVNDVTHKDGYRSRQWYLERKQPKLYGRAPELKLSPEATTLATIVQRAFEDKDGKILISEATASLIPQDEDNTDSHE